MHTAESFFLARQTTRMRWHLFIAGLISLLILVSLGFGPAGWDWRLAIAWMAPDYFSEFNQLQLNVVTQIRMPRMCLAVLVGTVLAQTGAATQALCRNPLADPSIIGVSAGAAVMAVGLIAFGPALNIAVDFWLPFAAFAGALLATFLVYRIAKREGEIQITTLLLVGVAINALSFALIGLFSFFADDSSLRLINYWTMGSLAGASWSALSQAVALLAISVAGLLYYREKMSLLLLGESEARYLGVDIQSLKSRVVILIALGVGAAVALTGLVGFVGLVVPHISRLILGPNLRHMMPLCMLIGTLVLLISDWLARIVVGPAELPIGIITAILGAPVFIYLLINQQRGGHA